MQWPDPGFPLERRGRGTRPPTAQGREKLQLFNRRVLDFWPHFVRGGNPHLRILPVFLEDCVIHKQVELAVDDIRELRVAVELPTLGNGVGAKPAELRQIANRVLRKRVGRLLRSEVVGNAVMDDGIFRLETLYSSAAKAAPWISKAAADTKIAVLNWINMSISFDGLVVSERGSTCGTQPVSRQGLLQ